MSYRSRINKRVPWKYFRSRRKFVLEVWVKKKNIRSYQDLVTYCEVHHIYPPEPLHKDSMEIYQIEGYRDEGNILVVNALTDKGIPVKPEPEPEPVPEPEPEPVPEPEPEPAPAPVPEPEPVSIKLPPKILPKKKQAKTKRKVQKPNAATTSKAKSKADEK